MCPTGPGPDSHQLSIESLRRGATRNVVQLLGGLGNQLFQVAFGLWLERQTGYTAAYDVASRPKFPYDVFDVPGIGREVRERLLPRTGRWASDFARTPVLCRIDRRVRGPFRVVRDHTSPGPDISGSCRAAWWFGYWQRAAYADSLLPDLSDAWSSELSRGSPPLIGVHVRRGDMLPQPDAVNGAWFGPALRRLREQIGPAASDIPVRVWSDDLDWCRSELDLGTPFEIAPAGSAVEHLVELANCKALVISRSTFSWWAAAVASRRGAEVVFPAPWWPGEREPDDAIIPTHWLPLPSDSR